MRLSEKHPVAIALAALLIGARAVGAESGFDANGTCIGDANRDSHVTINELITAVNNGLDGCGEQPVTITFSAVVADQRFACGNIYHDIGTTKVDLIPADLRFYLHDVRLVNDAGVEVPVQLDQDGAWQYQN